MFGDSSGAFCPKAQWDVTNPGTGCFVLGIRKSVFSNRVTLGISATPRQNSGWRAGNQHIIDLWGFWCELSFVYSSVEFCLFG